MCFAPSILWCWEQNASRIQHKRSFNHTLFMIAFPGPLPFHLCHNCVSRPTAIIEAPDGSLLVAVSDGTVRRITYAPVPNLCNYASSNPKQWWKRRCPGVSVTAGVVDSRGGPKIDGNSEIAVPGKLHPGVFAVGSASMYLLGNADLAPGQGFGWALHSAHRAAKEITRQLVNAATTTSTTTSSTTVATTTTTIFDAADANGAVASPNRVVTGDDWDGDYQVPPRTCTILNTQGVVHRSSKPYIGAFADITDATGCAKKCSTDSRCMYWAIHFTHGCQLRPDKMTLYKSQSFTRGHGECIPARCTILNTTGVVHRSTLPYIGTFADITEAAGCAKKCS